MAVLTRFPDIVLLPESIRPCGQTCSSGQASSWGGVACSCASVYDDSCPGQDGASVHGEGGAAVSMGVEADNLNTVRTIVDTAWPALLHAPLTRLHVTCNMLASHNIQLCPAFRPSETPFSDSGLSASPRTLPFVHVYTVTFGSAHRRAALCFSLCPLCAWWIRFARV